MQLTTERKRQSEEMRKEKQRQRVWQAGREVKTVVEKERENGI